MPLSDTFESCGIEEGARLTVLFREPKWMADPAWSKGGQAAIDDGWVSSVINDQWGNPNNRGADKLMLPGNTGHWVSRRGQPKD